MNKKIFESVQIEIVVFQEDMNRTSNADLRVWNGSWGVTVR